LRVVVTATNAGGSSSATSAPTAVVAGISPTNTAAPTISGTPQQGQTLTANPGTWSGTQPIGYAYRWRHCDGAGAGCSDIAGATAQTYTLVVADVGATIRVAVTASNSAGSSSATSAQTALVTAVAPSNTVPPAISGSALDGATLTADPGSWSGSLPINFAYQWQRCSANYANTIMADSPRAYWRVGETSGTSASDQSGNGNTGTYGGTFTLNQPGALTGDSNSAVRLTGSGNGNLVFNNSTSFSYGDTFSYELWVKLVSLPAAGTVSNLMTKSTNTAALRIIPSGAVVLRKSGGSDIVASTRTLSADGKFHHIVATKNGATVKLYIDGADVTGAVVNQTLSNSTSQLAIGHHPLGSGDALDGYVDEAAVYGVALTASQVQQHFAAASGCADITGATAKTYTLGGSDIGKKIRVVVTGSNSVGSATATSAQTATVVASAPSNTASPTISGTAQTDQTLTADQGTWKGTTPINYSFQWQRCDSGGAACAAIAGATGQTYTLTASEAGSTIRVSVTASNSVGTSSASSAPTAIVTSSDAPVNTAPPTISGTLQLGQTLAADPGTWSGAQPISYSYQWRQCDHSGATCSDISGATAQTHTLNAADVGATIRVRVTASNASGAGAAVSTQTGEIEGVAPTNVSPPTISGTPQKGQRLAADPGSWNGTPPIAYAYQWRRCNAAGGSCADIAGETAQTYLISSSDIGNTIRVAVTATSEELPGSGTAVSVPSGPITGGYRGDVMQDNPIAYWRLGEQNGSAAADETANANLGTYQGGITLGTAGALAGDSNTAAHFNGVDGEVTMGNPPSGIFNFGTGDFTVEAWMRTTVNNETSVIAKSPNSGPAWEVTVTDDVGFVGRVRAKLIDSNGANVKGYGPPIRVDDGNWHDVVAEFKRDTGITVFVDGVSQFSAGAMTGSVNNTTSLLLGHEGRTGYPFFSGDIDEVALYNSILPASRIQAHYESGAGVDTTPPAVTLTAPGASVDDATPTYTGSAGSAAGDLDAVTVKIYSGSSASGTPVQVVTATRAAGSWAVDGSPPLDPGTYTARAEQSDVAGNVGQSSPRTFTVTSPTPPPPSDPVVLAAGDIADCLSSGDEATASILAANSSAGVLTLGDNVYDDGTPSEFANCYDPTWGTAKARTLPSVGNHEYLTTGASGYYGYFGAAAGDPTKGYYSYDLGAWHLVVINSNCAFIGGCGVGSPEEQWLRSDLAAHPATCTLAYWHHPRFSGGTNGNDSETQAIWQALYDNGADLILNGHDHDYERFAPQTPTGALDLSRGISEFVVGTGGKSLTAIVQVLPNSEVRNNDAFGVLKLVLHQSSYDWEFVPQAGKSFKDYGSRFCH
jgi:fibronectin type 3 domain-containing protein